ncbi:MAG: hypothetical protein WDM88_09895 [Galbitalea sp.]
MTSAIVSSTNIGDPGSQGFAGAAARVDDTAIAVSDSVLSGYLRTAIKSTARAAAAEAMTELDTTLALISLASGGSPHPVLLTLDRNWASSDTNFERGVGGVYEQSWTSATSLSSVFATSPDGVKIADKTQPPAQISTVAAMLAAETREVDFAPIADDPQALTSSSRLRLLSVLSDEWQDASGAWATATKNYLSQTNNIVQSVQVAPSSAVLATADQIAVPGHGQQSPRPERDRDPRGAHAHPARDRGQGLQVPGHHDRRQLAAARADPDPGALER